MIARPLILVALMSCLVASPAWADDPALAQPKEPSARLHFTQGNRLYRARKLEEAIAAYQAGAAIEAAPVFDYNLGQCYRKLGRYAEALRSYERFLGNGRPEGELHDLVTRFLRQIREELERTPLSPEPATVSPYPNSPSARPGLTPGLPAARSGPGPAPGPLVERAGPAPMPAADRSASVVVRSQLWYSDRLGWELVVVGVVAAGAATYLRVRASELQGDAATDPNERHRVELRDAAYIRGLAGAMLGVGGVALLAGGVIKLAIRSGERPDAKAAAWSFGVSGRGVAVLGRF